MQTHKPKNPGTKTRKHQLQVKKQGGGGADGRGLIPYKERNDRGQGKKKKSKLARQKNYMA